MDNLLLFDLQERAIPTEALDRVFRSVAGFHGVQRDTPNGAAIEADYTEGDDYTTIELDLGQETISIRGTSGAALRAAWIVQSGLDIPLRMVDTQYSFDLVVSEYATIEDLEAAIDHARSG